MSISPIVDRFQSLARQQPDALAIRAGNHALTYAELDRLVRALQRRLEQLGLMVGEVVGISLERGLELVVAEMAILAAGGVCLPLDPRAPVETSRRHLRATRVRWVIGIPTHVEDWGTEFVWVDPESSEDKIRESRDYPLRPEAPDVGFILFTSGSTGQPKGVCIRQASVVHLVCDTDYVALDRRDVMMQGAHVSFDASLFEIWGALLNGARLEVIEKLDLVDPARLKLFLDRFEISIAVLTTSLFNLAAQHSPGMFANLRYLLVGGEVMDATVTRQVIQSGKAPQHLLNGYGPTETTTFATVHRLTPACAERSSIPIGRPIRRATCYLLDRERQPVATGDIGEIWIGGAGVSAGYWEQPELTAEKFWPDPWATDPDALMYSTGDLGRLSGMGELEFLGRRDSQVKIRGFRIELAEVERLMRESPRVGDVAVVPEMEGQSAARLIAFVQWSANKPDSIGGTTTAGEELLDWMRGRVASYLVPARIVSMPILPRTTSGKLDRRALESRLGSQQTARVVEKPSPCDSPEEEIRSIWRQLLRREDIPANANFFKMGGDSLEAVRMLMLVEPVLGRRISLGAWLEDPTIECLVGLGAATDFRQGPRVYLIEYLLWLGRQDLGGLDTTMLPFGNWGRSPGESTVPYVVENCLRRLEGELEGRDFVLVGYSMAGFVAYELAVALAAQGVPPRDVWLVDTVPPTNLHRAIGKATQAISRRLRFSDRWRLQLGRASHSVSEVMWELWLGRPLAALARLGLEAKIALSFLRRSGGVSNSQALPPASPDARPKNFHAMCVAHDSYYPSIYTGPVACFITEETRRSRPQSGFGWRSIATNLDFIQIPGTHSSCIRQERHQLLAALQARSRSWSDPTTLLTPVRPLSLDHGPCAIRPGDEGMTAEQSTRLGS